MLCKGISTVTQFTVMIFWLSAILNGKSSNSSTVTNETEENLLSPPILDDSSILRYDKWKFHLPRKIVNPTNQIFVPERNRTQKANSVPSVSGPSPETINGTLKTLENGASNSEFSSTTDLMGGGGLSLYGITNSFVNPGHVLSASIENGLEKLSELVNSIGDQTFQNMTPEVSPQFFGIGSPPGNPEPFPSVSNPLYPNPQFGAVQNATVAQFFGIANIYIGDGGGSSVTSGCPECPPANLCPSLSQHAILTVSITECPSIASFGVCSLASEAPTGTLFVLFPLELSGPRKLIKNYFRNKRKKKRFPTVSAVTIRIVASSVETKLKVTCPSIPPGISVTTQGGSIRPFNSREETGYVQLKVSGFSSSSNVAVACVWESKS